MTPEIPHGDSSHATPEKPKPQVELVDIDEFDVEDRLDTVLLPSSTNDGEVHRFIHTANGTQAETGRLFGIYKRRETDPTTGESTEFEKRIPVDQVKAFNDKYSVKRTAGIEQILASQPAPLERAPYIEPEGEREISRAELEQLRARGVGEGILQAAEVDEPENVYDRLFQTSDDEFEDHNATEQAAVRPPLTEEQKVIRARDQADSNAWRGPR